VRAYLIQGSYFTASILFILGLRGLTHPDKARRGIMLAEVGMLFAIIGTLIQHEIVRYDWIIGAMVVGAVIGAAMAILMPMTAVPQRTAISHMFGAVAAVLVGIAEYERHGGHLPTVTVGALGFEVMLGAVTITGSFMAFGKLQGFLPSPPITYPFQNQSNIALFVIMAAIFVYLVAATPLQSLFYALVGLGLLAGMLLVLPIGGADMPVVLSLLNSYAGLASAATGFVISNNVLIIAGALDGTSGFVLSMLMSKAMNRSFTNVLFGAFGSAAGAEAVLKSAEGKIVRSMTDEDAASQLGYSRSVIIVPGYGMAVSQAQRQVRELADLLLRRGVDVRFAIHPVAGRMPGHMNVLLADADVPYDQIFDMDAINDEFQHSDVALVIGANDVVNPAANTDSSSPIYGMPILRVADARSVIVLKRSMAAGFAGIENELFYDPKTSMLFGDAKGSLGKVVARLKEM
jgi:NAD(P) transhydrogenase subunit beta